MRVDQGLAGETAEGADQPAESGVRGRLDRLAEKAEAVRQRAGGQRQPGGHAEAGAAALQPQEQVGVSSGIGDADLPVRGHDLGLQQACRGEAAVFGEAAEAAGLDVAADPDARAAAALDISAMLRRDEIVEIDELGAGADADRRLRRHDALAALRHEGIVQLQRIHALRPDHQAVGRAGLAEIAVRATLDDEAQVLLPREVDRSGHIGGPGSGHRVDAGRGGPAVDPAGRLGRASLVLDEERVAEIGERLRAQAAVAAARAGLQGRDDPLQAPADGLAQRLPFAKRRPCGIIGADAALHGADGGMPGLGGGDRYPATHDREADSAFQKMAALHLFLLPLRARG